MSHADGTTADAFSSLLGDRAGNSPVVRDEMSAPEGTWSHSSPRARFGLTESIWAASASFLIEAIVLVGVFAIYAGTAPPDVNEAHYLGKARHFWIPDWCERDLFIRSSNAHWLFYVSLGWLNLWTELPVVAWIGRFATWIAIAFGWCYLCRGLTKQWGTAAISGTLFLVLQHFGHLAGEWIIGGVEAKGFAFALVFVGLGRMVRGDWCSCWIWWGGACAFHVLVGGWVVVAGLMAWTFYGWRDTRLRTTMIGLVVGGLISLIGVVPGLFLGAGVEPRQLIEAQRVYVFERLQHHLVFTSFAGTRLAWFSALLCLWIMGLGAVPKNRALGKLQLFVVGTLAIAATGVLINQYVLLTDNFYFGARYLRFYWFRSSDIFVPAATALSWTLAIGTWGTTHYRRPGFWIGSGLAATALVLGLGTAAAQYHGDGRPRADQQSLIGDLDAEGTRLIFDDWRSICRWVDLNLPGDAVVLTPRRQQTFKWYAQRAEVANWKDIPQDAKGLIQWQERFADVYLTSAMENSRSGTDLGLLVRTDGALRELASEYGADYLLVPRYQWYWRRQLEPPTQLEMIYPPANATGSEQENFFVLLKLR